MIDVIPTAILINYCLLKLQINFCLIFLLSVFVQLACIWIALTFCMLTPSFQHNDIRQSFFVTIWIQLNFMQTMLVSTNETGKYKLEYCYHCCLLTIYLKFCSLLKMLVSTIISLICFNISYLLYYMIDYLYRHMQIIENLIIVLYPFNQFFNTI